MLKRRIAAVALATVGGLGLMHAVMAATEINASNHTEDSKAKTGDADSSNGSLSLNGQFGGPNFQNGDNDSETEQDADARSGDALNGQVIGAVGSGDGSGGDTTINASNHTDDSKAKTGDATSTNGSASLNGQFGGPNAQEGDNDTEVEQDADAQSGDSVNGQVIGSAG